MLVWQILHEPFLLRLAICTSSRPVPSAISFRRRVLGHPHCAIFIASRRYELPLLFVACFLDVHFINRGLEPLLD